MITMALVDDHTMLRKSMAALLELMGGFRIIFQASDGRELVDYLSSNTWPDLVLMDVSMPVMSGPETTRWLREHCPEIKVVALSMVRSENTIIRMMSSGARAYLLKDVEPEELVRMLQEVHQHGYAHNEMVPLPVKTHTAGAPIQLSAQEKQFMQWVCAEKSHKEIAELMQLSPRTIDGYRDSLLRKLGVNSRVGIVMYALQNGIVPL
ncbi:MAG: response regulator [Bacteroidota bacterium]|jgi:two-component system invasion response regulator UvrY